MGKKIEIGDRVVCVYKNRIGGSNFTKSCPLVGMVESIGTHNSSSEKHPYKVSGYVGCWSADELTVYAKALVLTPLEKVLNGHDLTEYSKKEIEYEVVELFQKLIDDTMMCGADKTRLRKEIGKL